MNHSPFSLPRASVLRRRQFLALAWTLLPIALTARPAVDPVKEYKIKAAFLYNFTRFIEWPGQDEKPAADPFVIALCAPAGFADELEQVIGDRRVDGRPVSVRTLSSLANVGAAHLVFVADDPEGLEAMLPALHARNVLTVGETKAFSEAGGVITFSREGDKLRFSINLKSSEQAGLKVSAQLLKLATAVRR